MKAHVAKRSIASVPSIAIFVILVIVAAGGIYLASATGNTTNSVSKLTVPTLETSATYAVSGNQPDIPKGCMDNAGGQGGGYTLTIYLPEPMSVKPGDSICIETVVANVSNQSGSLILYEQSINVTDSAGNVIYRTFCPLSMPTAGNYSFPIGKSFSCADFWQSRVTGNGSEIAAGTYHVFVIVEFASYPPNNPTYKFALQDEADLELVPASGYTRTVVCYMGYTIMTESIIVNSVGSTQTVGSVTPGPPPANDTTIYTGICRQSGPY